MYVERLRVDHVADADHGGGRKGPFVDGSENKAVIVGINDARRHVPAASIDDVGRSGTVQTRSQALANRLDLAAFHEQVGVFQPARGPAGPEGRAGHENGGGRRRGPAALQGRTGEPLFPQLPFLLFSMGPVFRSGSPGFNQVEGIDAAVDPDFDHFILRIEIAVARNHGEVGDFAGLDGAEPVLDPAQPCGNHSQRRQGVVLAQTAVQCQAQVSPEILPVAQPVTGQRNLQPLLAQEGGIFRRPVPGAELIERDLLPVLVLGQLGQLGKTERNDERRGHRFGQVRPAPFLAAGQDVEVQSELARDPSCAVHHQRAARLEHDRHFAVNGRLERFERRIEFRPFAALWLAQEPILGLSVVAGVEDRLAQDGDGAHQRSRIGLGPAAAGVEGDMLKSVRFDDRLVGTHVRQCNKGARTAHNSLFRNHVSGGEPQFAS